MGAVDAGSLEDGRRVGTLIGSIRVSSIGVLDDFVFGLLIVGQRVGLGMSFRCGCG